MFFLLLYFFSTPIFPKSHSFMVTQIMSKDANNPDYFIVSIIQRSNIQIVFGPSGLRAHCHRTKWPLLTPFFSLLLLLYCVGYFSSWRGYRRVPSVVWGPNSNKQKIPTFDGVRILFSNSFCERYQPTHKLLMNRIDI